MRRSAVRTQGDEMNLMRQNDNKKNLNKIRNPTEMNLQSSGVSGSSLPSFTITEAAGSFLYCSRINNTLRFSQCSKYD